MSLLRDSRRMAIVLSRSSRDRNSRALVSRLLSRFECQFTERNVGQQWTHWAYGAFDSASRSSADMAVSTGCDSLAGEVRELDSSPCMKGDIYQCRLSSLTVAQFRKLEHTLAVGQLPVMCSYK